MINSRIQVKMAIGIFDSGVGGLSVLYDALKVLPNEDYIYYADTKNVPYGTKSKEELIELIIKAIDFIAARDVKAIVIACNTATSVAIDDLRARFSIPIIGMEPAIKPAVNFIEPGKRVMVFATELTLKEDKFIKLLRKIDTESIIDYMPQGKLVRYAEDFEFSDSVILPYLRESLSGINVNSYGAVVLGCTHFTFFRNHFQKIFPADAVILDGNLGTINNLKRQLEILNRINGGSGLIEYYSSGVLQPPGTADKYFRKMDEITQL